MQPESKSAAVDAFLSGLIGKDRATEIQANRCATCESPDMNFTDKLSVHEYQISGMSQKCQDDFFNNPPEEEADFPDNFDEGEPF